jgi:hypothetical protein
LADVVRVVVVAVTAPPEPISTTPEPMTVSASVTTRTAPVRWRPAAGWTFTVTRPSTDHDSPAARVVMASVTVTEP